MVTMSPLATWASSWPSTPCTASLSMCSSKPVLTATNARALVGPVAKALTSGLSKIPTSGILGNPADWANVYTVSTKRRSKALVVRGSITRTPMVHLASCRDIARLMNAPPKPSTPYQR